MSGLSQAVLAVFALVVVFYWFRYNCAVLLRRKVIVEAARQVASANQLTFAELSDRLDSLDADRLAAADQALGREYEVLICLLHYTSPFQPAFFTFDQRLLMFDFRVQQWWFGVTSRWMPGAARHTLWERINILMHFAHLVGKRTAVLTRA